MNAVEYREQFVLKAPRGKPEEELQKAVVRYLRFAVPDGVWWCASLSGIRLPIHVARRMKDLGMTRGAPDLSFILPDGRTAYLELKSSEGSLSPAQKRVRDLVSPTGLWAVCRSLDDVEAALRSFLAPYGVVPKARAA